MSASVSFRTIKTASNHLFGHAILDNPEALNALTLQMIDLLDPQLKAWAEDESIAGVVLGAKGDKAFCAGGDVVSLHHACKRVGAGHVPPEAATFFEHEYRLDYRIHNYPKPLLCWAHGIVMGGGVGLMVGASHRVVSPNARIAMPEVHIGLYPDVGGSWFLQRMPKSTGLFMGLTGAIVNAGDALQGQLADHVIAHEHYSDVLTAITETEWTGNDLANHDLLSKLLTKFASAAPTGLLEQHAETIEAIVQADSLEEIANGLHELAGHSDPWLARAGQSFVHGSPTSAVLAFELQKRLADASLGDVLRLEYQAALGCCAHPDFAEGVRALLVDKDKSPRWQTLNFGDDNTAVVDEILKPSFEGPHPLADLV
ncbi:enoyl-CoA hydratase/carnithine racemase [Limnobacter thiooxidans]|uniref:3-hydroxyisobutyryl-CoA hydrolase n=1 Tax=Limnobacter thiooxidans TaxID=131080 RepID=A0AA86M8Y1_9BURK|nr:enoyl-CoA hydratase/carnithine racemase [Limnobacter thiooxidans]BET26864.1 enoyl-CoA hydratase/isomerase family protein [Limnobacter thiooxidans]